MDEKVEDALSVEKNSVTEAVLGNMWKTSTFLDLSFTAASFVGKTSQRRIWCTCTFLSSTRNKLSPLYFVFFLISKLSSLSALIPRPQSWNKFHKPWRIQPVCQQRPSEDTWRSWLLLYHLQQEVFQKKRHQEPCGEHPLPWHVQVQLQCVR